MTKTALKGSQSKRIFGQASTKKAAISAKNEISYSKHELIEVKNTKTARIFNKVTGTNGKRIVLG